MPVISCPSSISGLNLGMPADVARDSGALGCLPPDKLARVHENPWLVPADRRWQVTGAKFRTSTGTIVALPGAYTAGLAKYTAATSISELA